MGDRPFDIVVFGATGFTGEQAAAYLDEHAPEGLKWAIAGRNERKLHAVQAGLKHDKVPIIVADALDREAIGELARQTRVVITTAGPYEKYGTPLVEACVEHGTHYVDITGETPWVKGLVDKLHDKAAEKGVRIVPFCGFDSIPSDLGAFMVASWIREHWAQDTRSIRGAFKMSGGLNGGTLDTAITIAERGQTKTLAHTQLLNPPGTATDAERQRSRDFFTVEWDERLGAWLMPFFMATVNTRVVRRSHHLQAQQGHGYGPEFTYQEMMETRSRITAWATALGMGIGFSALKLSLGRRIARRFGPAPGEGPSDAALDGGFFRVRLIGEAADGRVVRGKIKSEGDPGNRSTVRMLCESALTLALTDPADLPGGAGYGGILTPATALGQPLLDRLRATGKMEWTVDPD